METKKYIYYEVENIEPKKLETLIKVNIFGFDGYEKSKDFNVPKKPEKLATWNLSVNPDYTGDEAANYILHLLKNEFPNSEITVNEINEIIIHNIEKEN